ncbi:hypothetical protein [Pseudogemmobacter faecipullorum]|uniref:Uncharacterized protein n=1 Tax=Pseudogemmobacter faecipullorum TaxID=2755041 RepID=A0ABS8CJ96_9RHOB|nr:hypothetical protein [Pseudogemmobacter faecipullorum]MCB5409454.1 hypothetical protein [Pseudogemmobacter faecipullorum]
MIEIAQIHQAEGVPVEWPAVIGVTGDLLATCWARIEHYISRRFVARPVVWTLTASGGDWQPPLGPVNGGAAPAWFLWRDGEWQEITVQRGPFGYLLPAGTVMAELNVGQGPVPAPVSEAIRRLAGYLSAEVEGPAGARSYSANVGQLAESWTRDPAAAARALQNSGAADLLRPYRRA